MIVVSTIITGCATIDPVTGRRAYNLYQLEDDVRIGEQVHVELIKGFRQQGIPLNQDARRVAQLKTMVQRIGAVSHVPDFPYQVTLVHSNVVNALAAPGGHIVVFEGLYAGPDRLVENDDELAAVVAHEIAHITCRHVTRSLTRSMPLELAMLAAAIYAEVREAESIKRVLGGTMLIHGGLVLTHYARQDEREADRIGLEYMARAGYNPAAAVRLWQRVAETRPAHMPGPLNYLSTHPSAAERHRNLSHLLPSVQPIYERTRHGKPEPASRHLPPVPR